MTLLDLPVDTIREPGSNNWVVGGALSPTGKPIVSNDPHRAVTNPSLRYIVHLNAPGWNAIGATQPPFVGVSMGHNEKLAWGLTITGTDFQDVFIEDLNPANPNEIIYNGKPEALKIVTEEFQVKGEAPRNSRIEIQPARPDFLRGRKEPQSLRAAQHFLGARHGLVPGIAQARSVAELQGVPRRWRCSGKRTPRI